jgi:hypothetical protein
MTPILPVLRSTGKYSRSQDLFRTAVVAAPRQGTESPGMPGR